mmetsp:Transcript_11247/g.31904  ORF Transcript_11247/g.31904 Transcript_11247/m.31904 type:complete len:117 (-) Transcript_11247:706-1056(-)
MPYMQRRRYQGVFRCEMQWKSFRHVRGQTPGRFCLDGARLLAPATALHQSGVSSSTLNERQSSSGQQPEGLPNIFATDFGRQVSSADSPSFDPKGPNNPSPGQLGSSAQWKKKSFW